MNSSIFAQPRMVLDEALSRHAAVWPFLVEAIDLGHIADGRSQDLKRDLIPGTRSIRCARNEVNDACWRMAGVVCGPLREAGIISDIEEIHGGQMLVLPDGLQVRLKRADASGSTSNYPTRRLRDAMAKSRLSHRPLFSRGSPLDLYVDDGGWIDVVYVSVGVASEYSHVQVQLVQQPVEAQILDPFEAEKLASISPVAASIASGLRSALSA